VEIAEARSIIRDEEKIPWRDDARSTGVETPVTGVTRADEINGQSARRKWRA